ncbi:MAG: hypothetical protein MZV63_43800 [Marinilabiliales bacterium]|nr:hypothetical protein [Marinilabiliales bacterium]
MKDLDVTPQDPTKILAGNLGDDPVYMQQALGKIYASFIIAGQGANGGDDIAASDGNFFTTMRALWNLQEITTDEAICAWGDVGIADLNTQTWSPSNPFLTALYQRLALECNLCQRLHQECRGQYFARRGKICCRGTVPQGSGLLMGNRPLRSVPLYH